MNALGEKSGAPQQRLDQNNGDIRSGQCPDDTRQTRSGTDIGDNRLGWHHLHGWIRNHGAVEDVPFPDSWPLSWSKQSPLGPWAYQ